MEQGFKFYGSKVDPDAKKIWHDEPVNQEERNRNDLITCHKLFEDQLTKFMNGQRKIFNTISYERIAPQYGAFGFLNEKLFKNNKCRLIDFTLHSFTTKSMVFAVSASIPLPCEQYTKAFKQKLSCTGEGFALVTFYIGLCDDFTKLVRQNETIEKALKEMKELVGESNEAKLFEPNEVIPDLLNDMRAEQRYRYLPEELIFEIDPLKNFFYKTPEGFIFRAEVTGYAAIEEVASVNYS